MQSAHFPPSALLLALLAGGGPSAAAAQDPAGLTGTGTLLGQVVAEDTGRPLPGTGVEVWSSVDSTRLTQTVSNEIGHFRVARIPEGVYFLRLMNLGYATVATERFEVAYGETRDLGPLALPVEALELEPIQVSTERTVVTYEADRTSYNVGVMPGTEGASVTEALRGIPELEIDIDGRITLRGASPVIYIDGRPAPMSAEALALFLEQFPADYLDRIEVMENPSARYAAEGSGGIVNLVLKEGVELGLSGSVFASTGTRGEHQGGVRGTLQRGPWTFNGSGSAELSDVTRTGYDLRQNLLTDPAYLRQDSWSDRSGLGGDVDLQARFEPTDRIRVFARGRLNRSGAASDGLTTTTHLDDDELPILRYDRTAGSDQRRLSGAISTGFEYRWEPRRHELELDLTVQRGRALEDTSEEVTSDSLGEGVLIPAELTLDDRDDRDLATRLDVGYTHPWGETGRIEAGYELEGETTDNGRVIRFIDDATAGGEEVTDRGYIHDQVVQAGYLTLGRQLGDLGVQVGLRAEHTSSRFGIPAGDAFHQEYLNLFPSASVSYRPQRSLQFRLSYSRRIQRPSGSVLNPVNRSTDPLTRRVGNPDIEPQFTHSLSLNASWSGSMGNLRLSPYYRRTTNDWAETVTVDDDGVSTRTYQNVASQESYGASLTYSLRPIEGWNGFVSVSGRRVIRDASNLSPRYSGSSLRWSSRARIQARITGALNGETTFSYSPPVDLPQGRSDARYAADLGIRCRFLENRASLRLALRDPFQLRRSGERTQDLSYIQIGRSRESTRSAVVTLSYTFGGRGSMRGRDRRR